MTKKLPNETSRVSDKSLKEASTLTQSSTALMPRMTGRLSRTLHAQIPPTHHPDVTIPIHVQHWSLHITTDSQTTTMPLTSIKFRAQGYHSQQILTPTITCKSTHPHIVVVFPALLFPRRAVICPSYNLRENPLKAWTCFLEHQTLLVYIHIGKRMCSYAFVYICVHTSPHPISYN